jgi:DNA repair protein RecO
MYTIHTTAGFVIGSRPYGEAGKLLLVCTKELGLIRARAQGVRVEKSKLRSFIQDYAVGLFSFVRGKEYWQLTNAQELPSIQIHETDQARGLLARIASLLMRLLQGEEANRDLFLVLEHLFSYLSSPAISIENGIVEEDALESLVVIRILHRLGYAPLIQGYELEIATNEINYKLIHTCDK